MLASTLQNLVLITTFTFERLGELYDVETILRSIEGRRTIAASSFSLKEAAKLLKDLTL